MARKLNIVRQIWAGKGSYSQRKGLIDLESPIQRNELNQRTRTQVFDLLVGIFCDLKRQVFINSHPHTDLIRYVYSEIFSCSAYAVPSNEDDFLNEIFHTILQCSYNQFFDFCEKIYNCGYLNNKVWETSLNDIFYLENVCHRMVNGEIIDEYEEETIQSIKTATSGEDEASTFMQKAIHALYKLKAMKNAVLNSIHAVESVAKKLTNAAGGTLSDAVKELEKQGKIHPALSSGLKSIYGYTSDTVRHAKGGKKNPPSYEEAKFMLLFCSSTVNFLRSFEDRSA